MLNFHLIDFRLRKPLAAIYFSMAIRFFALSLISIFIPIYLLKSGYSIETILIFYFVLFVFSAAGSVLAARSLSEAGLQATVGVSSLFLVFFYMMLLYKDLHSVPIFALAAFAGVGEAFYILPMNAEFAVAADKKHESEEVGALYEIPFLAAILGPIAGGSLLFLMGFDFLFLLASFLMLVSVIPLFWAKEIKRNHTFRMPEKVNLYEALGIMSAGAREVGVIILWPLFLFLLVHDFVGVGLVETIALFSAALVALLVGKLAESYGERRVLNWGSIANAFSWPLRIMAATLSHIMMIAAFIGISAVSLLIPLQSMIYKNARKNPVQYLIFADIMRNLGRVFMVIIVIALSADLYTGLLLCGFAAIGCMLYGKGR